MPHDRKNYNKMQCLILTPIYSHTALPQALDDLIGSECFANHGWSDSPSYTIDRKSTRLNSSHLVISYAVFCLKKKTNNENARTGLGYQASHERQRARPESV